MTMRDKIADICDDEILSENPSCYTLADAIIAALPNMVKDLEWRIHDDGYFYAHSLSGRYEVGEGPKGSARVRLPTGAVHIIPLFDDGKGFCEKYHRALIMEAFK